MTVSSRGSPSPQRDSNSSSGSHASFDPAQREPSNRRRRPLESRLSNVVDVQEPNRLVEYSQLERQLRFQDLVRRYVSQIMYGCTNPACTTPTCLSCNKRLISRPFRAPTQLTARALAHYLASQDDPHKGLCPHPLRILPNTLEISGTYGVQIRQNASGVGQLFNVFPAARLPAPSAAATEKNTSVSSLTNPTGIEQTDPEHDLGQVLISLNGQHQKKKDVKSLGQNLYDTITVIFSLSKNIPNPLSVFSALRAPSAPRQSSLDTQPTDGSFTSSQQGSQDVTRHAVPSHVSESVVPMQTAHQHSQQSIRSSEISAALLGSEILNTGQQVHRIRHHLPDRVGERRSSFKAQDATHFDGTQENPASQPTAMRTRPSMLDLHNPLRLNPAVQSPVSTERDHYVNTQSVQSGPVLPVVARLDCKLMDRLKQEVYHSHHKHTSNLNSFVDYDTARKVFHAKPFVNRSLFFALSDPETLLQSFRDEKNEAYPNSPLPHLKSFHLVHSFRDWNRRNGALIFDSLWIATKALFTPPPEIDVQKSPRLKASRRSPSIDGYRESVDAPAGRYLSDEEAAHIVMICIHALTSLVDFGWPHTWVQLRKFRSWGIILPDAPPRMDASDGFADPWIEIIDDLEYEPALRLADRLLRGIGARRCFEKILATLDDSHNHADKAGRTPPGFRLPDILVRHLIEVERHALSRTKAMKGNLNYRDDPGWTVTATFIEWLRTIIIKKWDGKADINRWSSVGTAMTLLDEFHSNRVSLNLRSHMFYMPYLNERLDPVDEPAEFLKREKQPNSFHVFEYPCLFPPEYVVAYFRTMNLTAMYRHFERTEQALHLQRELAPFVREPYGGQIREFMRVTLSDYLILDVSREHVLEETLNQLWGLERRALLKPLKVRMGTQGGEVGQDQGGVTYEFFRVVLSEAFKPDTGMFTVDPETRMTWFQPASLEPDWKFEMLGILFSLAVYNGITLPVTFPVALYHNLLAPSHPCISPMYPDDVSFIKDGWPGLAKSFEELLSWKQEDVADVFVRSYSFSFEAFGQKIDVDMEAFAGRRWPGDTGRTFGRTMKGPFGPIYPPNTQRPALDNSAWERPTFETATHTGGFITVEDPDGAKEAPLVTNANRDKFVSDYIFWLTHKSIAPQLLAFRKGFRACLQEKSLYLFDPFSLKALVEGTQTIDVAALKASTRYEEGYHVEHPTITDFWAIVEEFDMEHRRKLLEFVTASERVPITGFESMNFYIVRQGPDTEMLPTSSTCFGKLMLPEYASKERLKHKLTLAIQNSKGFGVV